MYDLLKKYMQANVLVAIFANKENATSFAVGYINQLTENEVIILHVGLHGEYDGDSACYIDDIYKVETNNKYLNKLNVLKEWNVLDIPQIKNIGKSCFETLIDTAINNNSIIAIGCNDLDEAIIGYINKYSDDIIMISQINEYGERDGDVTICIDGINRIVINDVECCEIEKLFRYQQSKSNNIE